MHWHQGGSQKRSSLRFHAFWASHRRYRKRSKPRFGHLRTDAIHQEATPAVLEPSHADQLGRRREEDQRAVE